MTVELAIWLPLVITSFVVILEFSYAMVINASMWNATRDTARAVATHRITADSAEEFFLSSVFASTRPYDVTVQSDGTSVTVDVRLPGNDAGLTRYFSNFLVGDLAARTTMLREPV